MIKLDLEALHHNIAQIKTFAPSSKILAMVKDNAYGHGLAKISREISDKIDGFGVISLAEAMVIRNCGLLKPVVLLQGIFTEQELNKCIELDLTILVHHSSQVELLSRKSAIDKVKIWLKLNCGLNRLGFSGRELASLVKKIESIPGIDHKNLCIMSHLSSATSSNIETDKEIELFYNITKDSPFSKSLLNSAGIIKYPKAHFDWVRPGLMLYGVSPFSYCDGKELNLKPVMQFEAQIISMHQCATGDTIGYNKTWLCQHPTQIAIINVGYADGYPTHIESNTSVLINGERAPIIGRVSSDAIALDVTYINKVRIGNKVLLWGNQLPVEEIARQAKTVPDQLLCAVSQRCIS